MFGRWYPSWLRAKGSPCRRRRRTQKLSCQELESRTLLSSAPLMHYMYIIKPQDGGIRPFQSPSPSGYTPAQVRHAYGFDQVSFNGQPGDGAGTTIAITDAYGDPTIATDLHTFDTTFGIPDPPSLTVVNQTGGTTLPTPDGGWSVETSLDVEWAHAIAPGAKILLVEANTASSDLYTAVAYAASQPNVVAISNSWGNDEFAGETAFDSYFQTPAGHTGEVFLVASGDDGAPANYPAISPNVLAVGGTTLNLGSGNTYGTESAWTGSSGGISLYEPQPGFQKGVVSQSSTFRTNPDVSYDSDPNTGFPVCDSYAFGSSTPWEEIGGTSDASPQWAGLIAIADQGRILAGSTPIDGTKLLPMLYKLPAKDFHDITTGASIGTAPHPVTGAVEPAGPGYDLVTGIGTPVANQLIGDLSGGIVVPQLIVQASAPVSGGQVMAGKSFSITITALNKDKTIDTKYTGTISFSTADPIAILPASYTFTAADQGVHTFTNIRLRTAGAQVITIDDTNGAAFSATLPIVVTPAPLSTFQVQATGNTFGGNPYVPDVAAGQPFSVQIQPVDAYGNLETGYLGTVKLTSSDPSAVLPTSVKFSPANGGTAVLNVTLFKANLQSVTITDALHPVFKSSVGVDVMAGTEAGVKITMLTSARASVPVNVTVTVVDKYGNVVTDFDDAVHFTSTDRSAILPADYLFAPQDNGRHIFTGVTFHSTGNQSLTVSTYDDQVYFEKFDPFAIFSDFGEVDSPTPLTATAKITLTAGAPSSYIVSTSTSSGLNSAALMLRAGTGTKSPTGGNTPMLQSSSGPAAGNVRGGTPISNTPTTSKPTQVVGAIPMFGTRLPETAGSNALSDYLSSIQTGSTWARLSPLP